MNYSFEYIMPGNRVILNTLYKSKDVEIFGSGFGKVYALFDKFSIRNMSLKMSL